MADLTVTIDLIIPEAAVTAGVITTHAERLGWTSTVHQHTNGIPDYEVDGVTPIMIANPISAGAYAKTVIKEDIIREIKKSYMQKKRQEERAALEILMT
jgi:hypothetical protein